jgi:FixJ family two-component response regulator
MMTTFAEGEIVGSQLMPVSRPVVAVVDDDPTILKSLSRLLKASGYEPRVFDSAETFLDGLETRTASCVILDVHLPGISGVELRRRMAAAGSKLPVIFMTAVDDEAIHSEAIEAGGVGLLCKPFSARSLIAAIGRATGSESAR